MSSPEALTFARAAVRRFARAGNLLLTGRSFNVVGGGAHAEAVASVVLACGGRRADGPADYTFVVTGADWSQATAQGAGIVVDLAGRLTSAVRDRALPAGREGILLVGDTALIAADPARPPHPPLPAAAGRIRWAAEHMPLTASFAGGLREAGVLEGTRVGVCMVLEPKTAVLALALRDAGADVTVFSHRHETDETVAAQLRERGIPVFADAAGDARRDRELALCLLDTRPQLLLDDGAHVIRLAHEARPDVVAGMIGAAEETTSGVRTLRALGDALRIPVIAVNDAVMKSRFDNRYGTGQSCVFAIADVLEASDAPGPRTGSFDGASVAVLGFGPVGQGIAQFASALGARVRVADIDPRAVLEARYAGHEVGTIPAVVADADIVVSATGAAGTVTLESLRDARDGVVLAVAGGVDEEIETSRLREAAESESRQGHVATYRLGPRRVAVIDDGGCVNITAGEGNPIEIMDLSFAAQLQAVRTLCRARPPRPGVIPLPVEADREIARRALASSAGQAGWRGALR